MVEIFPRRVTPDIEVLLRQLGRILVEASLISIVYRWGVVTGFRESAGDRAIVLRVFAFIARSHTR